SSASHGRPPAGGRSPPSPSSHLRWPRAPRHGPRSAAAPPDGPRAGYYSRELPAGVCSPAGMSDSLLELDGSFGASGGQILRTSLALSLLTGRGFHLHNVRAGRPKPGLQPQHLQSVKAAAAVGQAQLRGASLRSTDLVFEPGAVAAGNYRFDIG